MLLHFLFQPLARIFAHLFKTFKKGLFYGQIQEKTSQAG